MVDDEADIRTAVAEVLAEEGYEVYAAGDGREALAQLRDKQPSVVLLDLMMPGMNGWEFRREQQREPELSDIPVIVLSAMGRAPAIEAQSFLQKPFDLDTLLDEVRRWTSRETERRAAPGTDADAAAAPS
ncbi:MAG TPA: response regulator [Anaeromyxobacteraceae bacterium]|nr:response regulator [Anaeromyxobacteraceae bacterium]